MNSNIECIMNGTNKCVPYDIECIMNGTNKCVPYDIESIMNGTNKCVPYNSILVFVEQREGKIQNVSFELISKAKELSETIIFPKEETINSITLPLDEGGTFTSVPQTPKKINTPNNESNANFPKSEVIAFIPGYNLTDLHANECLHYGADKVFICNDKLLENYATEPYTKVFYELIKQIKPESVLIGATHIGRDLAPRLSARLSTGLTADCTSLEIDPETGHLLMTRPAFGGNILATIICQNHRPQMTTVRPGVMQKKYLEAAASTTPSNTVFISSNLSQQDMNIEILEIVKETRLKKNITDAKILISAGRGLGKKENITILEKLAEKLGGEVSGSRAVVDAGWMEQSQQVGQTGQTVRPDLYIACGISGAIQHVAGMEESDLIIAINKNPTAPIFDVADLGIVGDVNQIIPLLIEKLQIN